MYHVQEILEILEALSSTTQADPYIYSAHTQLIKLLEGYSDTLASRCEAAYAHFGTVFTVPAPLARNRLARLARTTSYPTLQPHLDEAVALHPADTTLWNLYLTTAIHAAAPTLDLFDRALDAASLQPGAATIFRTVGIFHASQHDPTAQAQLLQRELAAWPLTDGRIDKVVEVYRDLVHGDNASPPPLPEGARPWLSSDQLAARAREAHAAVQLRRPFEVTIGGDDD